MNVKQAVHLWGVDKVTVGRNAKSSLACCSLPKKWWRKARYVRNTEYSKILSEFRGGQTGTGDRMGCFHDQDLSKEDGSVVLCPTCGSSFNKPYHWVVACPGLQVARDSVRLGDLPLSAIFDSYGQVDDVKKLGMFLDMENDDFETMREKAAVLDTLRQSFMNMWYRERD